MICLCFGRRRVLGPFKARKSDRFKALERTPEGREKIRRLITPPRTAP